VIHTAFAHHDFSAFAAAGQTDRRAIEALGKELAGSGRPLVVTSGTGLLTPGRLVTEADPLDPRAPMAARNASEGAALSFAARGVRPSIVRLAPSVHDRGDQGLLPRLIEDRP
jgi:hypothetical protein